MASTVVAADMSEAGLPVLAMLEATQLGQVAADPAGYVMTVSPSSPWRYTFTVNQACVGIYRLIVLDGDGLVIATGYVSILADDTSTYLASGSYQELAALAAIASTPASTLAAVNGDADYITLRTNAATAAGKPTSADIISAFKSDAATGTAGLLANAAAASANTTATAIRAAIGLSAANLSSTLVSIADLVSGVAAAVISLFKSDPATGSSGLLEHAATAAGKPSSSEIVEELRTDADFGTNGLLADAATAARSYTAGDGGRVITFSIDDGINAVRGARVVVLGGALVVASGSTNASGQVSLMIDDGSYTVRVATGPLYDILPIQDLVVAGDASVSYALTSPVIPVPASPGLCTVRFIVTDGTTPIHGARATASLVSGLNQTIDATLIASSVLNGATDANGIVDLTLIQFDSFTRGGEYQIKVEYRGQTIHDRTVKIPTASSVLAEDLN